MMYMIRNTWRAQRGKAPEIIDALKMVNQTTTTASSSGVMSITGT
jgi:hypothetical protein